MDVDLAKVFAFIIELDRLKAVLRKTRPVGLDRYENSAEHSWQLCLLALSLKGYAEPAINAARVVELLLVHDIPEIDTGDRIVYQGRDDLEQSRERAAAQRIFGLLPPQQAELLLSRWEEFDARQTPEARFAYAIDRLMPVLHNLFNDGQSWRENKVPLSKVLSVNVAIGHAVPAVWRELEGRIRALAAGGIFEQSGSAVDAA